jgi:hypothetical protein
MAAPAVLVAALPPCDLHLWGQDFGGGWWALVSWRGGGDRAHAAARYSAWVPARLLTPSPPADARAGYREPPSILLAAERAAWPGPWARPTYEPTHLGITEDPAASLARAQQ